MPTISIIIPFHNNEKTIKKTINSVVKSSFEFEEIILINNNSSDNSLNIVKSLQEKYPNIFIYEELTPGVSAARNYGMNKVTADYYTFLDADDILIVDAYQQMESLFSLNKKHLPQIVHFNFIQEYENKTKEKNAYILSENIYQGEKYLNSMLDEFQYETKHMVWSYLFQTKFMQSINVKFDTKTSMFEDIIFLHRVLSMAPQIVVTHTVGVEYCYHSLSSTNQLTRSKAKDAILNMIESFPNASPNQEMYFQMLAAKVLTKKDYNTIESIKSLHWKSYFYHQKNIFIHKIKRKILKV